MDHGIQVLLIFTHHIHTQLQHVQDLAWKEDMIAMTLLINLLSFLGDFKEIVTAGWYVVAFIPSH